MDGQAKQVQVPPDLLLSKSLSPCDVEALKRCLEQSHGDHKKCEAEVLAFQRACSRDKGAAAPRASPARQPPA